MIVIQKIKRSLFQLDILEGTFQQHRYPSVDIIDNLVEQLDLPTQKVTVKLPKTFIQLWKIQR